CRSAHLPDDQTLRSRSREDERYDNNYNNDYNDQEDEAPAPAETESALGEEISTESLSTRWEE
ncbi:MAG: hypothetical protein AAGM67_16015, partial [Bacteroidota bacterium]